MHIQSVSLKQFRCFASHEIRFSKRLVLIEGQNGSGKTSLLEALHYACHLRSFKTRTTKDLVSFGAQAFSIKLQLQGASLGLPTEITAGYSPAKRLIKINDTPLASYKDLVSLYRVITITDEDMLLVTGAPEVRRGFLDQAITLIDASYPVTIRKYLSVLQQRNALLMGPRVDYESYQLWTEQLCAITNVIRDKRIEALRSIEHTLNDLIDRFFDAQQPKVQLEYKPKELSQPLLSTSALRFEQAARRTLFGAHLDDYTTLLAHKPAKAYASRGQQKLLAMLLKVAQPATRHTDSCVFMLDDIVSDLDHNRLSRFFTLLDSFKTQIIITSPLTHPPLQRICSLYDYEQITLPSPEFT